MKELISGLFRIRMGLVGEKKVLSELYEDSMISALRAILVLMKLFICDINKIKIITRYQNSIVGRQDLLIAFCYILDLLQSKRLHYSC